MDMAMILAICGLAAMCAGVAVKIALGKGRNPVVWGALGLSLVGMLVVTVLPASKGRPVGNEVASVHEIRVAA